MRHLLRSNIGELLWGKQSVVCSYVTVMYLLAKSLEIRVLARGLTKADPKVWELSAKLIFSLPLPMPNYLSRHIYLGHLGNGDSFIITLTMPICIKLCRHLG